MRSTSDPFLRVRKMKRAPRDAVAMRKRV